MTKPKGDVGKYFPYTVVACPRCGSEEEPVAHADLRFEKLERQSYLGETFLAYWAPCPTNSQPILMTFKFMVEQGLVSAPPEGPR